MSTIVPPSHDLHMTDYVDVVLGNGGWSNTIINGCVNYLVRDSGEGDFFSSKGFLMKTCGIDLSAA
jgi:hypothetical protein